MGWQEEEVARRVEEASRQRKQRQYNEHIRHASKAPMHALWEKFKRANQALPPELRLESKTKNYLGTLSISLHNHGDGIWKIEVHSGCTTKIRDFQIYYAVNERVYKIYGRDQGFKGSPSLPFFPEEDVDRIMQAVVLSQDFEQVYNMMRDQPNRMQRKEMARAPSFLERLLGI